MTKGRISSLQLHRITGASLRQVQWASEQGWLTPEFVEGNRCFSFEDAVRCALVVQMRRRHMPRDAPKKITDFHVRLAGWITVDRANVRGFVNPLAMLDFVTTGPMVAVIDMERLREAVWTGWSKQIEGATSRALTRAAGSQRRQ